MCSCSLIVLRGSLILFLFFPKIGRLRIRTEELAGLSSVLIIFELKDLGEILIKW